ncbi:HipA N-terminal domain-containing protein [Agrobacterium tumefaciens]|uniref:HipA N-terminal domain-containing protein n=1 Tax=Agrobacterium tumefaciens TaxID=358 RepID=UPI001F15759A
MTNIYYDTLTVAHLTFEGEWRLDCDPGWEARRPAFPVSLTMPLRSGSVGAAKLLLWLANLLPETGLVRSFSGPVASLMPIINAAFTAFTALLYFMDFLFWLCYRCDARQEYDRWQAQVILTRRVIFPGSPVISSPRHFAIR